MTWADVALMFFYDALTIFKIESEMDKYPKLAALVRRVSEHPNIKAYLDRRPKTDYWSINANLNLKDADGSYDRFLELYSVIVVHFLFHLFDLHKKKIKKVKSCVLPAGKNWRKDALMTKINNLYLTN